MMLFDLKMRKHHTILPVLLLLVFLFQQCKKEEVYPPLVLTAEISHVSNHGLSDGAINITVDGGKSPYRFRWSNDAETEDLHDLSAGQYSVTVTDEQENVASDTFLVSQPPADNLIVSLTGTPVSVSGGSDGSACAEVSGGVSPYQYEWSEGSTTECITGLSTGMYYITVTDSEQVQAFDSIEIIEPGPSVLIIVATVTHPSVTGSSDGSIEVEVSGGYPPYSYAWSNGSDQSNQENLPAGEYELTVTDAILQTKVENIILSDSIFDADGNSYASIMIGDQIWMQSNLRVTSTPDGTPITSFAYNEDQLYLKTYGRLYSWTIAMNKTNEESAQGICPSGWHVPSDAEYKDLEIYLGMTPLEADMENTWRGAGVGTSLLIGGSSGYDAPMAGRCVPPTNFSLQDYFEYVWTSTEDGDYAWRRCLRSDSDLVGRWNTFPKTYAFSVRCLKDD
jgi:uncharacterized protein (TIGR02145 family)